MQQNSLPFKFLTITLSIVILFLAPILLIICIPLFLLRYTIGKIVPWIKPDFGKILTTRSSNFASDDKYHYAKSNTVATAVLEGNLDYKQARSIIIDKIIKARFPNGELMYPEAQQYMTTWGGYYFWKNDKSFDVDYHLTHYEKGKGEKGDNFGDRFTQDDMLELFEDLINKKWNKKKPLWEVIFVTNYYPTESTNPGPHSLLIIRLHHSFADGYSLLKLIIKLFDNGHEFANPIPERIEIPLIEKLKYSLVAPFSMAYTGALYVIMAFVNYPWKVPYKKQLKTKSIVALSNKIAIYRIKEIAQHFRVSFSSVLFAVLAGAERDMVLKKKDYMTDSVPAGTILPIPGHPAKLRNYLTLVIVNLPIGEADPVQRLNYCFKEYIEIKKSHAPLFFFYLMMIFGSFFTWVIKLIINNKSVPIGLTNFPGGKTTMYFSGLKCVELIAYSGLQQGCTGIVISALSHGENIRISPVASADVLTKEELREMTLSVQKHIDVLYQHVV